MDTRPILLIADDQAPTLLVLEEMLEDSFQVHLFSDGQALMDYVDQGHPFDLIISDVMMPRLGGFEVCRRIKANPATADIPVLFLSSLESDNDERCGLELGAGDFIHKPFSPPSVLARIRNHLALASATRQLQQRNQELEQLVAERTREIVRKGEEIIGAQEATITALCSLAELRDNETGNHILRTQYYVKTLAETLQDHPRFSQDLSPDNIASLFKSAPLHDIGKVAISDHILLKPGKLDAEEWVIMKKHCVFGRDAIARGAAHIPGGIEGSYLKYAAEVAYCHHERWDGSGYPLGLKGDAIPLSARLMALADVYDALITKRVYKPAFTHEEACTLIMEAKGSHFDPDIADAFARQSERFAQIANSYRDQD